MYTISVSSTFSSAHRLRNYHGKCEHTHGHNWKVEVHITGEDPGKNGLLLDFSLLKKKTRQVLKTLDHKDLNALPYFKKHNPTAENLAKYIYNGLEAYLRNHCVSIHTVTVWESEDSRASYSPNTASDHVPGIY